MYLIKSAEIRRYAPAWSFLGRDALRDLRRVSQITASKTRDVALIAPYADEIHIHHRLARDGSLHANDTVGDHIELSRHHGM